MNKKLTALLTIAFICFSACGTANKTVKPKPNDKDVLNENNPSSYGKKIADNVMDITSIIKKENTYLSYIRLVKNNRCYAVYSPKGNKTSENIITVYSLNENKILKEIAFQGEADDIFAAEKGVCRIEYSLENYCYIYNDNLQLIKKVKLSNIKETMRQKPVFCISNNLDKIAFEENDRDYSYLYISDLDFTNKHLILKMRNKIENPNELTALEDIKFSYDDNSIYFIGAVYPKPGYDVQSVQCYGTINIDGSNLKTYVLKEAYMHLSEKGAIFSDNVMLNSGTGTGRAHMIDNVSKKNTEFIFKELNESGGCIISEDGNYIATFIENQLSDTNLAVKIRIYDVKTKSIIKEFKTNFTNSAVDMDKVMLTGSGKLYVVFENQNDYGIYEYSFK